MTRKSNQAVSHPSPFLAAKCGTRLWFIANGCYVSASMNCQQIGTFVMNDVQVIHWREATICYVPVMGPRDDGS